MLYLWKVSVIDSEAGHEPVPELGLAATLGVHLAGCAWP